MDERATTTATVERPATELELADGTLLVPDRSEDAPSKLDGDREHAFTLADAMSGDGEPFAGYRRLERD